MSFRWTIARRVVQLTVIALIASPLFGLTIFLGNLSAGELFGVGLVDPLDFLQATLAARMVVPSFLGAAAIITAVYFIAGGRTFCSWVCPVYLITEFGDKIRRRLGSAERLYPLAWSRWSFGTVVVVSALAGIPLFEVISPIGSTARAIMFNSWQPLFLMMAILMVEILVARRIWCRSLCPVGGFYALLGRFSPVRLSFKKQLCTACGECSQICPVEEVLVPSLREGAQQVVSGDCTRCGACVDCCVPKALGIGIGYH